MLSTTSTPPASMSLFVTNPLDAMKKPPNTVGSRLWKIMGWTEQDIDPLGSDSDNPNEDEDEDEDLSTLSILKPPTPRIPFSTAGKQLTAPIYGVFDGGFYYQPSVGIIGQGRPSSCPSTPSPPASPALSEVSLTSGSTCPSMDFFPPTPNLVGAPFPEVEFDNSGDEIFVLLEKLTLGLICGKNPSLDTLVDDDEGDDAVFYIPSFDDDEIYLPEPQHLVPGVIGDKSSPSALGNTEEDDVFVPEPNRPLPSPIGTKPTPTIIPQDDKKDEYQPAKRYIVPYNPNAPRTPRRPVPPNIVYMGPDPLPVEAQTMQPLSFDSDDEDD